MLALALDDGSELSLLDVLMVGGLGPHFCDLAAPSDVATLAACSKAFAAEFNDDHLWVALLTSHFGIAAHEARLVRDPRRAFAQRAVCARWGLALPVSPRNIQKFGRPTTPTTTYRAPAISHSLSWSPESENEKDTSSPRRRPLRSLQSDATVDDPPCSSPAPPQMDQCTVARLQEGLKQLMMMGGARGMTACPVTPGDWSRWSARLTGADDGAELQLTLRYLPADESASAHTPSTPRRAVERETERDETEGDALVDLPRVHVRSPADLRHPNVDARTGEMCRRALGRRCSAVALIGEQLRAVAELLDRPVFDVPPADPEAAAVWYGHHAVPGTGMRQRPSRKGSSQLKAVTPHERHQEQQVENNEPVATARRRPLPSAMTRGLTF